MRLFLIKISQCRIIFKSKHVYGTDLLRDPSQIRVGLVLLLYPKVIKKEFPDLIFKSI